MEATQVPIIKQKDKDAVYIYSGILLSHKKEEKCFIFDSMDGPTDYHTKFICIIFLDSTYK